MKKRAAAEWSAAAAGVAGRIPRQRLHPYVVWRADERPRREKWAVALSGGSDSVALLLLLWAHWPERRARLTALHFDHRLRGAESTADARFCAGLCRALGVPLVSGRWKAGKKPMGEAEARGARFSFFEAEMASRRIRVLWLGHQMDDIAETMLMRIARGSAAGGLAAPRAVHSFIPTRERGRPRLHLRPLLTLKKEEIAKALREAGAPWREDSSNSKGVHFRNRIRGEVIPRWLRAAGRDALAGAALSRELLEEDELAIEAWVDAVEPIGDDRSLAVTRLSGLPRAVVRRALHRWLLMQPKAGTLSRQGFNILLQAVERGAPVRHSLGSHGFAVIRKGRLRFEAIRKRTTPH
jgi:tRNA(Ile)-lysidine synthase